LSSCKGGSWLPSSGIKVAKINYELNIETKIVKNKFLIKNCDHDSTLNFNNSCWLKQKYFRILKFYFSFKLSVEKLKDVSLLLVLFNSIGIFQTIELGNTVVQR